MQGLKTTLDRLGLSQARLTRLLGVEARTVSQWIDGTAPMPGPVSDYLHALGRLSPAQRRAELRKIDLAPRRLEEGLYGLSCRGSDPGPGETSTAVLRSGRILGSDPWGGVLTGSYAYNPARGTNMLHVRLHVPPGGVLVTGFCAGADGVALDIVAAFDRAAPVSTSIVNVAGAPVEVELTYLGQLPA